MTRIRKLLLLLIVCIVFLVGCTEVDNSKSYNNLEVSIVNVGQGDSIFIKTSNGKTILVDTGSIKEKEKMFKFLKSKDIKNIDMLIGTHPHEDHIGNMEAVVKNYTIGEIYMPKVTHTSKTFKNTINAIKDKGLTVKMANLSEKLKFDDIIIEFLAPNSESYKDLNNYSIVTKVTYGENSFLLTGDAEKESEEEMLSKKYDLKADVLKLAHHGSSTSNTKKFLAAVNPKFSVASCGEGNEYKHPHKEVVELLDKMNIPLLKTYETGTITFISDGKNITVNTER